MAARIKLLVRAMVPIAGKRGSIGGSEPKGGFDRFT